MRVDFPALLGPTKKAFAPRVIVNPSKALKFFKPSCWMRMDSIRPPCFVTETLEVGRRGLVCASGDEFLAALREATAIGWAGDSSSR